MARNPDWFDRLPEILDTLRGSTAPTLNRANLQDLFAVGERDSWRLLHRFGADRTAEALTIERSALITQLEAVGASTAYQVFCRRRNHVAGEMAVSRLAAQARFRRISGQVEFVTGRTLPQLPPGITLEPGRIEARFDTEEDLWWLLDQLADIAAQDAEAFREQVEPSGNRRAR